MAQASQHIRQAEAHDLAILDADVVGAGKDLAVCLGRGRDLAAIGLGTHRHVADGAAVFLDRGDVGLNPVEVAVLAAVLHQASPWDAGANGLPQVGKRFRRHVRVADDVLRLANQLRSGIAADVLEVRIYVDDIAFQVGLGDDRLVFVQLYFLIGYR
jgi:hypothetical protein